MKLQIRVDESGVIKEAKFKTFGCGSAIASSSYMTELVKGKHLDEAGKIKNTEIAKELCLPPVKLHCSSTLLSASGSVRLMMRLTLVLPLSNLIVLAEDAIRSAINDYKSKRQRLNMTAAVQEHAATAA